jgi:hypothetical protein
VANAIPTVLITPAGHSAGKAPDNAVSDGVCDFFDTLRDGIKDPFLWSRMAPEESGQQSTCNERSSDREKWMFGNLYSPIGGAMYSPVDLSDRPDNRFFPSFNILSPLFRTAPRLGLQLLSLKSIPADFLSFLPPELAHTPENYDHRHNSKHPSHYQ